MAKRKMSKEDIASIRKMQAVLLQIDNGEKVFFNITQYQKQGLVESKTSYRQYMGATVPVKTTWHLTPKARQFLNIMV